MVLTRILMLGLGFLPMGCLWKLYEPEPTVSPMTVAVEVRTGQDTVEGCIYRLFVNVQRCIEDPASHESVCDPPSDLIVRMGPLGAEVVLSAFSNPGEYQGCVETQPDPWIVDVEGGGEHIHVEMAALALPEVKPAPNGVSWTPSGDPNVTMDFAPNNVLTLTNTPDDGFEDFSTLTPPPLFPLYLVILRRKRAPATATFTGVITQYINYPDFEPLPP